MNGSTNFEAGGMDENIAETDQGNPEQNYWDDQEMQGITPEDEEMKKKYRDEEERKKWDPEYEEDNNTESST